jgi:hypothetical protein
MEYNARSLMAQQTNAVHARFWRMLHFGAIQVIRH